jgi:hypothetical protein
MIVPLFRIFVLFIVPLLSLAGGSVDFQTDVAPLLIGHPDYQAELRGIDFDQLGAGERISGRSAPALAGQRVGPYDFIATSTGTSGAVRVHFETEVRFYDGEGRRLAEIRGGEWNGTEDLRSAVRIEEELIALDIKPVS